MAIRLLERFVVVAELGSVNTAAQRLNLSQPAVPKSIQMLERRAARLLLSRVGFVHRRDAPLSQAARALMDTIREVQQARVAA